MPPPASWPQLGVGVFSSGPLLEAQLLQESSLQAALESTPQLRDVAGTAPRLLQLARSCPGVLCSLVGHKAPAHVQANLALSNRRPLTPQEFQAAVGVWSAGQR